MMMSIARALKEKNRLVKEIDRLWTLIHTENSCVEDIHTRSVDVKITMQTVNRYTDKLVELKTKIGNANQSEQLRKMHLLDETKNKLSKLNAADGSTDEINEVHCHKKNAVFNTAALLKMKHQLQMEANHLQDELDAYNAETQIDFETPLY